ncbi:MAG: hypothetical protein WCH46_07605 [bacterium]
MIPSRELELGGLFTESARIIKKIFWQVALLYAIFTIPGEVVMYFGASNLISDVRDRVHEMTVTDPTTPTLIKDYFLLDSTRGSSLSIYRLLYSEVFTAIDSARKTAANRYPDSGQLLIKNRLEQINQKFTSHSGKTIWDWLFSKLMSSLIIVGIGFVLLILGIYALRGAIFDLSSRAYEERSAKLSEILKKSLSKYMWLLITQDIIFVLSLCTVLGLVVGLSLLISPLLIVLLLLPCFGLVLISAVRLLFRGIALVSEELGPLEGLNRSFGLSVGNFWRIVGYAIVATLLVYILETIGQLPINLIAADNFNWIVDYLNDKLSLTNALAILDSTILKYLIFGLISGSIFASLWDVFTTTFYYDLRTRKEGSLDYPPEETINTSSLLPEGQ